MNLKALLGTLMLAMLGAGTANAAIISKTYAFTAETAGPISAHEGLFSYDYDTDLNTYSLTSFDFTLGEHTFSLVEVGMQDFGVGFIIGGLSSGINAIRSGDLDFVIIKADEVNYYTFAYSVPGGAIYPGAPIFTEVAGPVDVAEPGTMGLIGAGFVGLGLAALRRRKVAA